MQARTPLTKMFSGREKAVETLLHGHGCAVRLKRLLDNPTANDASASIEDLSNTNFDCFSDVLSFVIDNSSTEPRPKKRKANPKFSRNYSPIPIYYDGYIWRKYGQKEIKSSKHHRCYYRCTWDTVCKAKKRVEKTQENPPVYRTTYLGEHTCQNQVATVPIVLDSADDIVSSQTIIRFDKFDQDCNMLVQLTTLVNQQEIIRNEVINQTNQDRNRNMMENQFWASDSPSSAGTMTFESPTFLDVEAMLDTSEFNPFYLITPFDQLDSAGC